MSAPHMEATDRLLVETADRVKRAIVEENRELLEAVEIFGDPLAAQHLHDMLMQQWRQRLAIELAKAADNLLAADQAAPGEHGAH